MKRNHQVFRQKNAAAWISKATGSSDKYFALFNLGEEKAPVTFPFRDEMLPAWKWSGSTGILGASSITLRKRENLTIRWSS